MHSQKEKNIKNLVTILFSSLSYCLWTINMLVLPFESVLQTVKNCLHVCTVHQWRLKYFIVQQMHKYITRRYNQNYYKIFKNCSSIFWIKGIHHQGALYSIELPDDGSLVIRNNVGAILNIFKYFVIILIVSTNYVFVHLLGNKVF